MSDDKALAEIGNMQEGTSIEATRPGIPTSIFTMTSEHLQRLKLLAEMYAKSSFSKSGKQHINQGDAFLIMMKGVEIGLSPMTAMGFMNIIHGQVTVDGKGMLALIHASGKAEYINIDSRPEQCTITTKRADKEDESEQTFVWDKARASEYTVYEKGSVIPITEKAMWQGSKLQVMLKWRCVSEMARQVYPDVIGNLYTKEEIADNVNVQPDGTMEIVSDDNVRQLSASNTTSEPDDDTTEAEIVGDDDDGDDDDQPKRGVAAKGSRRIEHWARNDDKKGKFLNYAQEELHLGSPKEAWNYIKTHFADEELTGLSDITRDFEASLARIRALAAEKFMDDNAGNASEDAPDGTPAGTQQTWIVDTLTTHKGKSGMFHKLWKKDTKLTATIFTRQPLRDAGYDEKTVEAWGKEGEYNLEPFAEVTVEMDENGYWQAQNVERRWRAFAPSRRRSS